MIDDVMSPGRSRTRFIAGIILIPLAIGAVLTVVFAATRPQPYVQPPLPSPSAVDILTREGEVLILEPATQAPIAMAIGTRLEVVLQSGIGQLAVSMDTSILGDTADASCAVPVCGSPGVRAWTFAALKPGTTDLHIIFGTGSCPQRASCPRLSELLIPVTVTAGTR